MRTHILPINLLKLTLNSVTALCLLNIPFAVRAVEAPLQNNGMSHSSSQSKRLKLPPYDPGESKKAKAKTAPHGGDVQVAQTCTDDAGALYEPQDPGYERCRDGMERDLDQEVHRKSTNY